MSSQLGWTKVTKAWDAGRAGARQPGWGDEERPARRSRGGGLSSRDGSARRASRATMLLVVVAVVAVTIVSWAVTAGATPQPSRLATAGPSPSNGSGLIAAGGRHTCVVMTDHTVSCWGDNTQGQLGAATVGLFSIDPVRVASLSGAIAVAAGDQHTCALLEAGTVSCWGEGSSNQLGDGTSTSSATPVAVSGISDAVAISAGLYHACALHDSGRVSCWGDNEDGALGNGTNDVAPSPVEVTGITNARSIAVGGWSSCAVLDSGSVHCWGYNGDGQLGDGTEVDSNVPIAVTGVSSAASVAIGPNHACAVRVGGAMRCWGYNYEGQLGNGTLTESLVPVDVAGMTGAVAVGVGWDGTCALSGTGTVSCWGRGWRGELGNGTGVGVSTIPTSVTGIVDAVTLAVGSNHRCVVRVDGSVWCWGDSSVGEAGAGLPSLVLEPSVVDGVGGVEHIATGRYFTCAQLIGGGVTCWGAGDRGQLGNGAITPVGGPAAVSGLTGASDVTAGEYHACAVLTDRTMRCWGENSVGQLGDGTGTDTTAPVTVSGLTDVTDASAGHRHTCAVESSGAASCWGSGLYGRLGNGSTSDQLMPTAVATTSNITAISAGTDHTCGRAANGAVGCWGENLNGRLGDGTTTDRTEPVLVSTVPNDFARIDSGGRHSCASRGADTMCWGANSNGQLGDGALFGGLTPVTVSGIAGSHVRAGGNHTCGIVAGGGVKCWGYNSLGQLGDGSQTDRNTPVDTVGLTGVTDLDLGEDHSCAVLADATVACWGDNDEGQLGAPSYFATPVATAIRGAAVPQIATPPGPPGLPAGPGYVPLDPARLLDTRSVNSTVDGLFAGGGRRGAGSVLELVVAGRGGVPVGAAAVVVNVTVVDPLVAGFVTVSPCGVPTPVASSLNFGPGDVVPNELVAKVGVNGSICVFTDAETHLLADVVGYMPAGPGYVPLDPARLLDTRSVNSTVDGLFAGGGRRGAGSVLELVVAGRGGVPVGAAAVVVNVTVVDPLVAGFVTVSPCGVPTPVASSLNFGPGDVVPNELVAKVGVNGSICVFTDAETHLLADVVGYMPAGPGYVPLDPARLLDTRSVNSTVDGLFAGGGRRGAGSVLELVVAGRGGVPVGAAAVVVNVTVVDPLVAGFVTVSPCGVPTPVASSLNFGPGDVVPNELVAKVGVNGSICVFTDAETHLLADVVGYMP